MARAWRIEYEGALYHVLSRGNQRQNIVTNDDDRNLFANVKDKHQAYREFMQKYSKEEHRTWEDLRHGIFVGTEKFVKKIKKRYLPDIPHTELPDQKQVTKSVNLDRVLSQAAGILKCDMELCRKSARISKSSTLDRDLLIYTAWQLGVATNQQIGEKFGLTYSSVSQRARVIKEKLHKDKALAKRYQQFKSLMKI
jgi:hypothetical protein